MIQVLETEASQTGCPAPCPLLCPSPAAVAYLPCLSECLTKLRIISRDIIPSSNLSSCQIVGPNLEFLAVLTSTDGHVNTTGTSIKGETTWLT